MATNCPYVDREDQVQSYLSDKLSPQDAEAFEKHYFECDRCWQEVQRALELRASVVASSVATTDARAGARIPVTRTTPWKWLGAAAMVILAVALWRIVPRGGVPHAGDAPALGANPSTVPQPSAAVPTSTPTPQVVTEPPTEPVLRSPAQSTLRPIATAAPDGGMHIEWRHLESAANYKVRVVAADGTPVATRETSAPSLNLDASMFAGRRVNERLFATIEATNALGVVIASGPRMVLPSRK